MRRNARWYFAGLAASLLGNSAMSLVAGIWVKSLTGSSSQAGLVSVCIYAPTLIAPLAGLVADRAPRKPWLISINLIAGAAMLPLLAVRSSADVWIIFAAMAVYGIEATLIDPAEDALFAEMFTREFRRRITGWRLAIQESGRLAAPLLGAALFALIGGGAVATLDAATFVDRGGRRFADCSLPTRTRTHDPRAAAPSAVRGCAPHLEHASHPRRRDRRRPR